MKCPSTGILGCPLSDGVGDTEATGSLLAAAWELPEPQDAQPASATATRRTNAQRVMHQGYVDHRWKPASRCRVRTLMPRSVRSCLLCR